VGLDRLQIAFLSVVVVAALAIGALGMGLIQQGNRIDRNRYEQCVDQRELVERILLQGTGATLAQWKEDPGSVLDTIRQQSVSQLTDLGLDPNTPSAQRQINRAVNQTRELLDLSDPDGCVPPGG